jgi:hypothetical protein
MEGAGIDERVVDTRGDGGLRTAGRAEQCRRSLREREREKARLFCASVAAGEIRGRSSSFMRACWNRADACIPIAVCLSPPYPIFSGGREPVFRRGRTLAPCKFGWPSSFCLPLPCQWRRFRSVTTTLFLSLFFGFFFCWRRVCLWPLRGGRRCLV